MHVHTEHKKIEMKLFGNKKKRTSRRRRGRERVMDCECGHLHEILK